METGQTASFGRTAAASTCLLYTSIGKIAGEQIMKLCTLGLTEEEAEEKIIAGFLK